MYSSPGMRACVGCRNQCNTSKKMVKLSVVLPIFSLTTSRLEFQLRGAVVSVVLLWYATWSDAKEMHESTKMSPNFGTVNKRETHRMGSEYIDSLPTNKGRRWKGWDASNPQGKIFS